MLKHTFKKLKEDSDEIKEGEEEELQEVRACPDQCKSLTTFFKHYGLQLRLKHSLKQECETRWNTKLQMLDSVLDVLEDVQFVLPEQGEMQLRTCYRCLSSS